MSTPASLRARIDHSPVTGVDAVTWLSLYLVALYAIPSRLVVGPLGSAGAVSMLVGLASLGIWVLYQVAASRPGPMTVHPIRLALVIFFLAVGSSYALAMSRPINSDEISPADVAMLSVLSWSGTLLMTHDGIPSRERLKTFVWRLSVCGALLAIVGLIQFVTGRSWVDTLSIPGLTATNAGDTFFRNGLPRPVGTATHPIEYGALLTILLPISLHVAFHHRNRPILLRWCPPAAIAAVVAVSSSRTAYLGAAVGLLICLPGWPRLQRNLVLGVGAGSVLLAGLASPRLLNSITELFGDVSTDPSITSRTDSYSYAWAYIVQHPFFGRGYGTFLPKYRIFDNQYLLLLVSAGVVGTLALLGLAVGGVLELLRVFRRAQDAADRDLALSVLAALGAGFLSLAFFDAFAFPMTMGTLFLMLGLGGAVARLCCPSEPSRTPAALPVPQAS